MTVDEGPLLFIELHNEMIRCRKGNPAQVLTILMNLGYKTLALDGNPTDAQSILAQRLVRKELRTGVRLHLEPPGPATSNRLPLATTCHVP